MPIAPPMKKAKTTGTIPINSDSRVPRISRDSISRPSSSEPSGKPSVPIGFRRRNIDVW
ncbi:hypothetical protein D3C73_1626210 [compost metagenome]